MSRLQVRLQTHLILAILSFIVAVGATQAYAEQQLAKKFFPGHYIYGNLTSQSGLPELGSRDDINRRQRILGNDNWAGYYVDYKWADFEPSFGVYDFTKIIADLDTAQADGKALILGLLERLWETAAFPGPSYMNPASPDFRAEYADMYFAPASDPHRVKPNLWKTPFGDRMVALLAALGSAVDSHPALAAISFQETANVGMSDQPGYTPAQYLAYLKRLHTAAAAAFPTTIVHQTTNWGVGMSNAQLEELAVHLVEVCKASIGSVDLLAGNDALDNAFGKFYRRYRNVGNLFHRAEPVTYSTGHTAQENFNYSIDEIGNNMQAWYSWRVLMPGGFNIDNVMTVVNAENGRVNPIIPSNLQTPESAIPRPDGVRIILE